MPKTPAFNFSQAVLSWFDQSGRKNLPWQTNPTPYRVWVSEIMLQQTQVTTVIDYYLRFMDAFPSVEDLANADEDQVLHLWTGLGYYARARNLHKTAKIITDELERKFPTDQQSLEGLPGIGRSTAAAIISLACNQKATILDGNVKRVLARCFAIKGWTGHSQTLNTLWSRAEELTPETRNREYTQAMMDLGATLCKRRKPLCGDCPLSTNCLAMKNDLITEIPGKKPKKNKPTKSIYFLIAQFESKILLHKRPNLGIWGGLWSFREFDDQDSLMSYCETQIGKVSDVNSLAVIKHSFSHYHLNILPIRVTFKSLTTISDQNNDKWYDKKDALHLGLAAPVKTLIQHA